MQRGPHTGARPDTGRFERGESHPSARPIAFFLEGRNVPSSRFRIEQYQEYLRADQIPFRNFTTRPSKYLSVPTSWRHSPLRLPLLATGLGAVILQRIWQILLLGADYRSIVLQRDFLYRIPLPFLESLLFWRRRFLRGPHGFPPRIVFDVDDAIFLGRHGQDNPAMQRKIDVIARGCDRIITGNGFLRNALGYPEKSVVIPTPVPLESYPERVTYELGSGKPVVGWIGQASNLPYLEPLIPAFERLSRQYPFELRLVCEAGTPPPFSIPNLPITLVPWSREHEIDAMREFDIGIMPLPDTRWAQGKCAFKLLQYMGLGIPAVASPVGMNTEVLRSGANGLLARDDRAWEQALLRLFESEALRQQLGRTARQTVQEQFSRARWYPAWLAAITDP